MNRSVLLVILALFLVGTALPGMAAETRKDLAAGEALSSPAPLQGGYDIVMPRIASICCSILAASCSVGAHRNWCS